MDRDTLKRTFLSMARSFGAFRYADHAHRGWLRILSYHGVGDDVREDLNRDGFFVSEEVFEQQMAVLKQRYEVLPLCDALEMLPQGTLPDNAVCLTFDDGYWNNYDVASVILKQFDFPATFFVTTSYMDGARYPWWWCIRKAVADDTVTLDEGETLTEWETRLCNLDLEERDAELERWGIDCVWSEGLPKMMSWENVEILSRQGFDIGGHTMHHVSLAHEDDATIRLEVLDGVAVFQREGIEPSQCFAYPYGKYSNVSTVEGLFEEAGVKYAVMDEEGLNYPDTHPLFLNRIGINDNHDPLAFEAAVSGFSHWVKGRMGKKA